MCDKFYVQKIYNFDFSVMNVHNFHRFQYWNHWFVSTKVFYSIDPCTSVWWFLTNNVCVWEIIILLSLVMNWTKTLLMCLDIHQRSRNNHSEHDITHSRYVQDYWFLINKIPVPNQGVIKGQVINIPRVCRLING